MSNRSKDEQVRRHLRGLAHQKSREDRKKLQEKARARRATGDKQRGPRRRDWRGGEDETDSLEFERIRTSKGWLGGRASPETGEVRARIEAQSADAVHDGVVAGLGPGRARVITAAGELDAELAPELARTQQSSIAVGDEVSLDPARRDRPRVVGVAPRRTFLSRPDPGSPQRVRVLAANVDVAVLVQAVRMPGLRPGLIDRFLVALARGGVAPLVVANKADLLEDEAERASVREVLEPYAERGTPWLLASADSGEGVDALRERLRGRTCVFAGHSGVGKSTLLNLLDPGRSRDTGAGRGHDGKGRHTTTSSELVELSDGTRLIDTPGIRTLGVGACTADELEVAFPDVAALAAACRFRDCAHLREPDCAVRAAVDDGRLDAARWETFVRLRDELDAS